MTIAKARKSRRKSLGAIAKEWDAIAIVRDQQIRSGKDVSYIGVLVPEVVSLAQSSDRSRVLDAGCGTGSIAEMFALEGNQVVGIDASKNSIGIAKKNCPMGARLTYSVASIERFSNTYKGPRFTLAVANMLLQDCPDLSGAIRAIAKLLKRRGHLVLTITHPWFWPRYWGYEKKRWFRYGQEIAIEAPFRISGDQRPSGITTHFHRPLEIYVKGLRDSGFEIEEIREPLPSRLVERYYPSRWDFPRFLSIRCLLSKNL